MRPASIPSPRPLMVVASTRWLGVSRTSAHVGSSNVTVRNARAAGGGGIWNTGTLMVTNSTVKGNTAS